MIAKEGYQNKIIHFSKESRQKIANTIGKVPSSFRYTQRYNSQNNNAAKLHTLIFSSFFVADVIALINFFGANIAGKKKRRKKTAVQRRSNLGNHIIIII